MQRPLSRTGCAPTTAGCATGLGHMRHDTALRQRLSPTRALREPTTPPRWLPPPFSTGERADAPASGCSILEAVLEDGVRQYFVCEGGDQRRLLAVRVLDSEIHRSGRMRGRGAGAAATGRGSPRWAPAPALVAAAGAGLRDPAGSCPRQARRRCGRGHHRCGARTRPAPAPGRDASRGGSGRLRGSRAWSGAGWAWRKAS